MKKVIERLVGIFGLNLVVYSHCLALENIIEGLKALFYYIVQSLAMLITLIASSYIPALIIGNIMSIYIPNNTTYSVINIIIAVPIIILGISMTLLVGDKINPYFVKKLEKVNKESMKRT